MTQKEIDSDLKYMEERIYEALTVPKSLEWDSKRNVTFLDLEQRRKDVESIQNSVIIENLTNKILEENYYEC